MEGNDLHLNPFRCVDLQWFADGDPAPGSGGEPGRGPAGGEPGGQPPGGEEPPETPPAGKPEWFGTWVAQAPDKYKKDEAKVKDLLKHKSIGEVLDRMYAAEDKAQNVPTAPEKPEGYEFADVEFPEELRVDAHKEYREQISAYLTETQQEIRKFAHELGLSKEAAQKVFSFFSKQVFVQETAAREAFEKAKAEGEETLKKDWKDKYDPNIEMCRRVISTFDEDGKLAADIGAEGGLANKPSLIKFVFKVSQAMSEDILVPGSTTPPELSPQEEKQKRLGDRYPSMAKGSVAAPVPPPSVNLEDLRTRYPTMGDPS